MSLTEPKERRCSGSQIAYQDIFGFSESRLLSPLVIISPHLSPLKRGFIHQGESDGVLDESMRIKCVFALMSSPGWRSNLQMSSVAKLPKLMLSVSSKTLRVSEEGRNVSRKDNLF